MDGGMEGDAGVMPRACLAIQGLGGTCEEWCVRGVLFISSDSLSAHSHRQCRLWTS